MSSLGLFEPFATPARCCAVLFACCATLGVARAQTTAPLWHQALNGPASFSDAAIDVTIDDFGNVYTVGNVYWSPQPNLFVPKIGVVKHTSSGQLSWTREWGAGFYGGNGNAAAVEIAPNGNIIVAGALDLGADWVVLAYDVDGNLLWQRIWAAASWFVSQPSRMKLDGAGNIYLCGDFGDPVPFESRAALLKLDASGVIQWTKVYDGTGNSLATISDFEIDAAGEFFLTGAQEVTNSALQFAVSKTDAAGNPLWLRAHGLLSLSANDIGRELEFAPGGRIVATGEIGGNTVQGPSISTICYDTAGVQQWRHDFATAFVDEYADALAVDASGAVFVGGLIETSNTDFDALLLRIDSGALSWSRTIAGASAGIDRVIALTTGVGGRVTVAGERTSGGTQLFAHDYDVLGTLGATTTWVGPNGNSDDIVAIEFGGPTVFAVASTTDFGAARGNDIVTSLFDRLGQHTYCTAKVNSLGCTPQIGWTGVPSATSLNAFTITCSQVINQRAGLLFYGTNGPSALPFKGGTMCVALPIRRTPVQQSGGSTTVTDCSGVFGFDFNAWARSNVDPLLLAGTTVDTQYWYRDPASTFFVGLSDAAEFVLAP